LTGGMGMGRRNLSGAFRGPYREAGLPAKGREEARRYRALSYLKSSGYVPDSSFNNLES